MRPPLVEPSKTGRTRDLFATLPSRFLEIEEAPVAQRPRTISGSVIGVLMIAAFVPFVIWLAVILSSPIVWVALAIIACTSAALSVRRRRAEAARERAWVDTFSFGEAVRRKRAKDVAVKAEESLQRTARHSFSA